MKILFLDVDGVLNSAEDFAKHYKEKGPMILDPVKVAAIYHIVKVTGCKIVFSSTWRKIPEAMNCIKEETILMSHTHEDWRTVSLNAIRGVEIAEWLNRHNPEVTAFAILDDDSDMLPDQELNYVRTTWGKGLEEKHVERVIQILGVKEE